MNQEEQTETPTVECASCVIDVPGLFRRVKEIKIAKDDQPSNLGAVYEYTKAEKIDGRSIQTAIRQLEGCDEGTRKAYRQLPGFVFEVVGHDQQVQQPKAFDGDDAQAEAAGWVQNEFGWCCTDCQGTAHETEDSTAGLAGLDAFMAEVGGGEQT
jgi:hypothetical protein